MAIDWDAELLAPVMAVFGEDAPCRYMPAAGVPFDLVGAVFDAEYQDATPDGEVSASTATRPVLGVRDALFAQPPAQGDRVLIRSVGSVFIVMEPRSDGHGHTKLMLMAAKDQSIL